jgi:hypothetical protein
MTSPYGYPSSTNSKSSAAEVEVERISRSLTRLVKNLLRESSNTINDTEVSTRQQQTFEYCMRILGR